MDEQKSFEELKERINELESQVKEIKAKNERQEKSLSSLDTGLSVINPDRTISWVNKKTRKMFPGADPIGQICYKFFESSDKPCEPCPTIECFKSGIVEKTERYNPSKGKWYQIIAQPVKDKNDDRTVNNVLEGITDITAYKQAEQMILQEKELLNQIMETSPVAITLVDREGHISMANARAEEILGLERSNIYNRRYNDPEWHITDFEGNYYPDEQLPFQMVQKKAKPVFDAEHAIVWPDGKKVLLSINATPLFDNENNFNGMVSAMEDITERKKAEAALRQSEEKYRKLYEDAAIGIFHSTFEGRFLDVNPALARMMGYETPQDVVNSIYSIAEQVYVAPQARDEIIGQALAKSETVKAENRFRRKDGSEWNANLHLRHVCDSNGQPLYLEGFLEDITERKRAEEELRKNEKDLRESQRIAHIGSWRLDVATNQVVWTEELYNMYGFDPSLPPPPYTEHMKLFTPESWERLSTALAHTRETGIPYSLELETVRKDGSNGWMWVRGEAEVDSAGKTVELWGVAQDITERKRAETYREIGREVLQILNEPGDLQESIQRVLAALKTRTGFDAVGLRLQEGDDFPYFVQDGFSKDFLLTENTLLERGKDGGVCRDKDGNVRLECTCGLVISGKTDPSSPLFTKGGSSWTNDSFPLLDRPSDQDPRMHPRNNCIHQGYASVALIPVRTKDRIVGLIQLNDKRKGRFTLQTIEILEDIAAHIGSALMRKRAEEALEKNLQKITASRNQLEHEVAERFKVEGRLKEAIEAAEAANKTKSEFLANMSHEIRTPMNSIIGFSQLIRSEDYGSLNKRQAKYADHIIESGNMLLTIINDILDLSRVESGKIRSHSEPFNIKRFMEHISGILSVLAEKKELAFKVEVDSGLSDYLTGDEKLIAQVLKNLISNAVNFTEQGEVYVSVENAGGNLRIFKVRDTGIGVPEKKQHRLFDKFFQVDSSYTKKVQGTGLGLAISKSLVELMGGKIEFESEQGKGSTFYFTLELPAGDTNAANPFQEASSPDSEPSVQPGLKILLAEDDCLTRKAITHFLEKAGYMVTRAETGNEVLSILESDHFDIILMDVQMPEMDGVEATKTIRNKTFRRWNPEIPILALTAYAMAGDREQFIDAGMTDYLSKPVDFTELNQKINRLIQDRPAAKEPPASAGTDHICKDEDIADIQAFLESNKDDPEFAGEILKSFPSHVSERMARLEAAVENKDVEEIAAAAHKFIALFSAIYIRSACKTSRNLQNVARIDDLTACEQLFSRLKVKMQQIVHHIQLIKEER